MFTNTNVGQCHSQLAIFNHLAVSGTRLSYVHTHFHLSRGGVLTPRTKWVSTLITCGQWGVKVGVIAMYTVWHMIQKPAPSSRYAGRFQVRPQLATCDLTSHVPCSESTSAGQLLQLTWSSVHCSLLNLISVLDTNKNTMITITNINKINTQSTQCNQSTNYRLNISKVNM